MSKESYTFKALCLVRVTHEIEADSFEEAQQLAEEFGNTSTPWSDTVKTELTELLNHDTSEHCFDNAEIIMNGYWVYSND